MHLLMLLCLCCFMPQDSALPKSTTSEGTLNPHLEVFAPMIGKTFRGEFANSTPEKPMVDVSKWERAMNGQAIRILHSVNQGQYGGETIVMWDETKKKIVYWYFTTAGFHTEGSFEIEGSTWISTEKVTGSANGVTEVRATSGLGKDGTLHTKAEYLRDGKWEIGREVHYVPSPESEVVFR